MINPLENFKEISFLMAFFSLSCSQSYSSSEMKNEDFSTGKNQNQPVIIVDKGTNIPKSSLLEIENAFAKMENPDRKESIWGIVKDINYNGKNHPCYYFDMHREYLGKIKYGKGYARFIGILDKVQSNEKFKKIAGLLGQPKYQNLFYNNHFEYLLKLLIDYDEDNFNNLVNVVNTIDNKYYKDIQFDTILGYLNKDNNLKNFAEKGLFHFHEIESKLSKDTIIILNLLRRDYPGIYNNLGLIFLLGFNSFVGRYDSFCEFIQNFCNLISNDYKEDDELRNLKLFSLNKDYALNNENKSEVAILTDIIFKHTFRHMFNIGTIFRSLKDFRSSKKSFNDFENLFSEIDMRVIIDLYSNHMFVDFISCITKTPQDMFPIFKKFLEQITCNGISYGDEGALLFYISNFIKLACNKYQKNEKFFDKIEKVGKIISSSKFFQYCKEENLLEKLFSSENIDDELINFFNDRKMGINVEKDYLKRWGYTEIFDSLNKILNSGIKSVVLDLFNYTDLPKNSLMFNELVSIFANYQPNEDTLYLIKIFYVLNSAYSMTMNGYNFLEKDENERKFNLDNDLLHFNDNEHYGHKSIRGILQGAIRKMRKFIALYDVYTEEHKHNNRLYKVMPNFYAFFLSREEWNVQAFIELIRKVSENEYEKNVFLIILESVLGYRFGEEDQYSGDYYAKLFSYGKENELIELKSYTESSLYKMIENSNRLKESDKGEYILEIIEKVDECIDFAESVCLKQFEQGILPKDNFVASFRKEIYLSMLLGINENFDDNLLQDVIEMLKQGSEE